MGGMNRDQIDGWVNYLVQFGMVPADFVPPKSSILPAEPQQVAPADENPNLASIRAIRETQKRANRFSEAAKERAVFDSKVAGMRRRPRRTNYEVLEAEKTREGMVRVLFRVGELGESVVEMPGGEFD
jgi:hypothetical protein